MGDVCNSGHLPVGDILSAVRDASILSGLFMQNLSRMPKSDDQVIDDLNLEIVEVQTKWKI